MEQRILDNALQWKKRQFVKLSEVSDLTRQLAQALDRKDQVSVRMVLSMREEPVRQAAELEEAAQRYLLTLPEDDAIRLNELFNGAEETCAQERPLREQVARNRRLLQNLLELDRRLSQRLGGGKSFYRVLDAH